MQAKEPLIFHDIPERPWKKIGVDFFTVDGADHLCTVDYYSDYFEMGKLSHKKDSNTTIKRLKSHFATHDIPLLIVSDNGPPFNSREFRKFTKQYELEHVTSSPEYLRSNGKVESAMKIAKRLIRKTNKDGTSDLQQALLEWRNTPTEGLHSSPAQRIFGQGRNQPHSPGWARVHLPHFFLKFWSIFLIFPQNLLIFFLILALRVG